MKNSSLFYACLILVCVVLYCFINPYNTVEKKNRPLKRGDQVEIMIPSDDMVVEDNYRFFFCDGKTPIHLGDKFLFKGTEASYNTKGQYIIWKPLNVKERIVQSPDDNFYIREGLVVKIIKIN